MPRAVLKAVPFPSTFLIATKAVQVASSFLPVGASAIPRAALVVTAIRAYGAWRATRV